MEGSVIVTREGPIGWVIFNRPHVKNAFNLEMWRQVPKAVDQLATDPNTRVIFLRGKGGHFGAGADIKELLEYAQDPIMAETYADTVNQCFSRMTRVETPTIALVEGYALGGGAMVATAADMRVVSDKAVVGIPLPRLGLAVEPLGIKHLMESVGLAWASKFLLTAAPIPMKELEASGWASAVAEEEKIEEIALSLAYEIMQNSPVAIRMTKRIMGQWLTPPHLRNEEILREAFAQCMKGEEFKEGAKAFLEKRRPSFSL